MIVCLDKGIYDIQGQLAFVDVSSDRYEIAESAVIKDKLTQHDNIREKLIRQTYDGASVMHCHLGGVYLKYNKSSRCPVLSIVQLIGYFLNSVNLHP